MKDSRIEWCDHTFNPWVGCAKVSPGCLNCYAERRDIRLAGGHWGKGAPRQLTSDANWRQPMRWNDAIATAHEQWAWERDHAFVAGAPFDKPEPGRARVFCASLADWLDDEVPVEWLARLLGLIAQTPNIDWLLLTKRPENFDGRLGEVVSFLESGGAGQVMGHLAKRADLGRWICRWLSDAPPANVWVGTTVEDQARANERIPHLLRIPAKVRFLSCEPLLGPVDLNEIDVSALDGVVGGPLNWVICGGESGPGARPMHPDWARSLRDQCAAAGVPFFFKQWGEWGPGFDEEKRVDLTGGTETGKNAQTWINRDGETGSAWLTGEDGEMLNWTGSPDDSKGYVEIINRVGKKAAGRLLDGREHSEFPRVESEVPA
ncbi:MAG: phage Gp37/Gp68 family protein [Verrucomicrobia bacterium]|nr:phage Gp37/Gp68 family protein [Verrucomicrobiota bacterium]